VDRDVPIVFVIYAELTAPVVRAQTMPLVAALREAGRRVDAATFTSPRRLVLPSAWATHHDAYRALADATGTQPFRMTHLPRDRNLERLGRALATELHRRELDDAILFCRQPRAALVGITARDQLSYKGHSPRVVLDLRGIRDVEYLLSLGREESELSTEEAVRLRTYREQERAACEGADAVLGVSKPMVQLVGERYGIGHDRVGSVANHARPVENAENLRSAARGELNVGDDEILITYCGTLAAWQMAEESALLVRALDALEPEVRLMYLTPDEHAARGLVKRVGMRDVLVRSALQEEVPRLLAAADYGLLLRQSSPVNRVACPVKFGEYLACGLRPILTPGIGDQSRLAQDEDLGVVVTPDQVDAAARCLAADIEAPGHLGPDARAKRRAYAAEHLSPERAARELIEFLGRALD